MFSWWVKFAEKFTRNIQNGCVYIGSGPINVKIKNGEKRGMVSDELIDVKSYVFICLGSIGEYTFLATFYFSRNPIKIYMIFEKILRGRHMITHND